MPANYTNNGWVYVLEATGEDSARLIVRAGALIMQPKMLKRIKARHESGPVDGPSMVFMHGSGTSGSQCQRHMDRLADLHCLAPDFPRFGRTRDQDMYRGAD